MGHMTDGLKFNALRGANVARVGHFKNKHGKPAHSTPNGSDWNPAQWIQATFGELGEMCMLRCDLEAGRIPFEEYAEAMPKELADVGIYLDIAATRCLDVTANTGNDSAPDPAQVLMYCLANLGAYANMRKKYDRGDITAAELDSVKGQFLAQALSCVDDLMNHPAAMSEHDRVVKADPHGVNLGEAVIQKFNEVSDRVGSPVWIDAEDWHFKPQPV